MRRYDLEDVTILIKKSCPKCNSTGFYDIPGGEQTCPNCRGVPGVRVEEEVSVLQFICMMEQYKQDNALKLTEGLKEVYAATAVLLNPGHLRGIPK